MQKDNVFSIKPPAPDKSQEILIELVGLVNNTCLLAVDKAIKAMTAPRSFAVQHARVSNVRDRMLRAVVETGLSLPKEQRACHK